MRKVIAIIWFVFLPLDWIMFNLLIKRITFKELMTIENKMIDVIFKIKLLTKE